MISSMKTINKNVLLNNKQLHHKMKTIRSHKHQLGSYEINKVSLSCFDDKHYIHNKVITSYAYGHYKIEQINNTSLYFYQIPVSILWRRYGQSFQDSLKQFTL